MNIDAATDLIRETLMMMLLLSAPILVAAMVIGLAVSLFQAVTQIQEQTLSFVPKIMGMGTVAILAMPWLTQAISEFAIRVFGGQ